MLRGDGSWFLWATDFLESNPAQAVHYVGDSLITPWTTWFTDAGTRQVHRHAVALGIENSFLHTAVQVGSVIAREAALTMLTGGLGAGRWASLAKTGMGLRNALMAGGAAVALAPVIAGGVGLASGFAGGLAAGLSGSATLGAYIGLGVNVAALSVGVGLMSHDLAKTGKFLYDNWKDMDAVDIAGVVAPRAAAMLGGWAARGATKSAYRWGAGKGYSGGSYIGVKARRGTFELHHSDPVFMGGSRNQKRTREPVEIHRQLHNDDMYPFLEQETYGSPHHMRPLTNNSGPTIRNNFSRGDRLASLAKFYDRFAFKYPASSSDFFCLHPDLVVGPDVSWVSSSVVTSYSAWALGRSGRS